jgi:DNA/RNA-binding domain of Phe-tRNA-synthetase-like protein
MWIAHAPTLWADFPQLVAGVCVVAGVSASTEVGGVVAPLHHRATERLTGRTESELPEIQAWRRAYAQLGLKPTQYRCASEALLRRFRREGTLPSSNSLVDLGNALSLAYAIPVAVFDQDRVDDHLEIRYATGKERFETFGGDTLIATCWPDAPARTTLLTADRPRFDF